MSDIDLTEAVGAAARERWTRVAADKHLHGEATPAWEDLAPQHQHGWREPVLAEVAAAAPFIERAVREQLAREIETVERLSRESRIDRPKVGPGSFLNDWQWAADVARGGEPR